MALMECPECGHQVSTEATTCPGCGHMVVQQPKAAALKQNVGCGALVGAAVILGLVIAAFNWSDDSSNDKPVADPVKIAQQKAAEDAKCSADVQCWADRFQVDAMVACRPMIEAKAIHEVKWKDGILESMFTRIAWADDHHKVVRYIGDKVYFQNGFGAMDPMIYSCSYDTGANKVVDVQLMEGRLPQDDSTTK